MRAQVSRAAPRPSESPARRGRRARRATATVGLGVGDGLHVRAAARGRPSSGGSNASHTSAGSRAFARGERTRRSSRARAGPSRRSAASAPARCRRGRRPGHSGPSTPRNGRRASGRRRSRCAKAKDRGARRRLSSDSVAIAASPAAWRAAGRATAGRRRDDPADDREPAAPRGCNQGSERALLAHVARRPFGPGDHEAVHRSIPEPLQRLGATPLRERSGLALGEPLAAPAALDLERAARPAHGNPVRAVQLGPPAADHTCRRQGSL